MKKLSFFACALAFVGLAFTACEKGGDAPTPTIADGFYCVGPATAVASIDDAANLPKALMGAGTNEVDKSKRAGMYEKYIALEANKEFSLVLHKTGEADVVYGADLEEGEAISDNPTVPVSQYKGLLATNKTMKVDRDGLYHIILDLNLNGDLDDMGGAQIVVIPCAWGLRGDLNAWGYTAMEAGAFNKEHMEFVLNAYEVKASGSFKFAHSNCWKFNLDQSGAVKAENSIGTDATEDGGEYTKLVAGGKNIPLKEIGIYNFKLVWDLKGGTIANSFGFTAEKAGAIVMDPADFVIGISGSMNGWGAPAGAFKAAYKADQSTVTDQATKAGTYVYEFKSVTFPAASQFKFRQDDQWLGLDAVTATGVTLSEADGNIAGVEGCYDIVITLGWDGGQRTSFAAAFTPGTPGEVEYKTFTVTGIVPEGWEHCYIWAWNDTENFTGGNWPGEELQISADHKVAKTFTQIPVPISVIFSNGAGAQTNDISDINGDVEINISEKLK